jgi:signal transduction histidine kinase
MVDNAVQAIEKKISDSACGRFTQTEPGVVEIITRSGKGHYTLIIKDTGVGIKKESLPKIWIPFYSEFDVRPGLGLLLCEKIVKNHGAAIKVSSQEGAWTEFEVTFECKT